jgi:hypothetical protein
MRAQSNVTTTLSARPGVAGVSASCISPNGGLMMAGSDPASRLVDDATLRRVLSESVRRVLEPYRPA